MGVSLEHAQYPAVRYIPTRGSLTFCTRVPEYIRRQELEFRDQFVNIIECLESHCGNLEKDMSMFLRLDVTPKQPSTIYFTLSVA